MGEFGLIYVPLKNINSSGFSLNSDRKVSIVSLIVNILIEVRLDDERV